jgi:hypothetical protein
VEVGLTQQGAVQLMLSIRQCTTHLPYFAGMTEPPQK